MMHARPLLLILALACFLFAAFEARFPRVNLVAAGLLFEVLAQLLA